MARNLGDLFTKENWKNYPVQPGPSHSMSQVFVGKVNGRTSKQAWTCSVCKKELSSKRSYTEHMNIHNKTRPFRCEHCSYAAASQMTLHRHKLRNHTPKAQWGYRCPYCDEAYMEPAGYQQHVQQRHTGKSATYGCPFRVCNLRSKSQRHFREHLAKHDRNDKIENGEDPCQLLNYQLVRYIVNDEIGIGYGRNSWSPPPTPSSNVSLAPLPVQKVIIRARPPVKIAPASSGIHQNQPRIVRIATERKFMWNDGIQHSASVHHHNHNHQNHHHNNHQNVHAPPTSGRYYVPVSSAVPQFHEEMEYNHNNHHHNMEMNGYEEEYIEDEEQHQEEDYDDDGPPVLNPETLLESEEVEEYLEDGGEEQWIEQQEVVNTEVRVFSNGFIDDDELD